MPHRIRFLLLPALFVIAVLSPVYASNGDKVHFAQRIVVDDEEAAGSLVCIGCSITMRGSSADVVAIGGSILIDGAVKGDVVAVGGGIRLEENAAVSGDVVTVGGQLWRDPAAAIKGEVKIQSGAPVFAGLILIPLVPVVLVIALIVWLVSRNRPAPRARA